MKTPFRNLRLAVSSLVACTTLAPNSLTAFQTTNREASSRKALSLIEAVQLGLAHHPRANTARAYEDATNARRRGAASARFPSVSLEGSAMGFQEPMIVAPLHGFDPTQPPVFARFLMQSRLLAHYTIFDLARGADIDRAEAVQRGASAMTDAAEADVVAAVATAYVSVVTARQVLVAEDLRLTSLQQERDRVGQFFAVGRSAEVEVLRADAAVESGRASRVAVEQELETSLRRLAQLVGLPIESITANSIESIVPAVTVDPSRDEIVAQALEHNPALTSAHSDLEGARAETRAARATWLPTIRVSAGFVSFDGNGAPFTSEWQGGISLSYPIFTAGARTARIDGAEASTVAAESTVREKELELSLSVDRAVATLRESRARTAALERVISLATEVTRIEQLALDVGSGVQTDFLRAEAELFVARADFERSRHAELNALITLAKLTGVLTPDWLRENVETQQ